VRQQPARRAESSADVLDLGGGDSDSGLVETPESKPAPKPRPRRPRKSSASKTSAATDAPDLPKADGGGDAGSSEAAE
jgi:hypothetical protein